MLKDLARNRSRELGVGPEVDKGCCCLSASWSLEHLEITVLWEQVHLLTVSVSSLALHHLLQWLVNLNQVEIDWFTFGK